jgi:phosphatidate phosphatase APP1
MEIKSAETLTSTPDAAFVYIDLGASDAWERLEKMLAEAELPAVDMFTEQVDAQPAEWSRP